MKISKRFTDSVKLSDGTIKSFSTEIQSDELVLDSPEKIISESDKLFAQTKWLVERDQATTFGIGA